MLGVEQYEFLDCKINGIEKQINELQNELTYYRGILEVVKSNMTGICTVCSGKGKLIAFDGGDSYFDTCPECNGRGE